MSYQTTAEQRSSFMTWAAQRIAKEVEENERIEKLTGTRDILPQKFSITDGRLTKQQKLHLIKAIDEQRDMGLPAPKAAKIYGLHHCTYTKWRRIYSLGRYVRK
tara:strand:- start:6037 stop:6348 length:312 start_codon:yes stop_codon:yes gene_type:complete